jgi:hypothetical protein
MRAGRNAMTGFATGVGYQLAEDVSLEGRNTFRVPARAAMLADVTRADALAELFEFAMLRDGPTMVLGEGSNLLLVGDVPGVVVGMTSARWRSWKTTARMRWSAPTPGWPGTTWSAGRWRAAWSASRTWR